MALCHLGVVLSRPGTAPLGNEVFGGCRLKIRFGRRARRSSAGGFVAFVQQSDNFSVQGLHFPIYVVVSRGTQSPFRWRVEAFWQSAPTGSNIEVTSIIIIRACK